MGQPVLESLTTADLEQAREVFAQLYVDNELRMGADPGTFDLGLHTATAGPVHVGRMQFGPALEVTGDPLTDVVVVMPLAGTMLLQHPAGDARLSAHVPGLVPQGTEIDMQLSTDFGQLLTPVPMSVVVERAVTALGEGAADLRFCGAEPVDRTRARAWAAAVLHVERELRASDSLLGSPLVQAETIGMLAAHALATFPNTAVTIDHLPGAGWVDSAVVRRAVAHIEEHADQPLTTGAVAEAAGVGARALQLAFRRHLGTTPLAHLRSVRLDRAHRQLTGADPADGTTVRQVAAAWGFGDLHRFTVAYRARFGQHPSATLAVTPD